MTTPAAALRAHHGVLTLTGYGLRVAVERGHLVVEDGIADQRREFRFSRIDSEPKRIVIIGHSGHITLDAIAWLHGVGVPLIHLDHDGRAYLVSSPAARGVAQLRRAQARALDAEVGFRISRDLLAAKVQQQLQVLEHVPDGEQAKPFVADALMHIRRATTLLTLRDWEARAARAYWRAWRCMPVQVTPKDARRCPAHWRVFGSRISPLSNPSPRKAVNPANAVLNYLYAMLEAEATIAALGMRLDPMLGFLHADRLDRASLACDLMEPVRPVVDTLALSLLRDHTFSKADAFERPDGHCRLLPPLTRQLAATAPLWAYYVRPVADQVARALVRPTKRANIVPGVPMPRLGGRRRAKTRHAVVRGFDVVPGLEWGEFQRATPAWRGTRALRKVFGANRAWDKQHGPADPDYYRREIQPKLATVSLKDLMIVTGLSKTSCNRIRHGRKVPHPRHWEGLKRLATTP